MAIETLTPNEVSNPVRTLAVMTLKIDVEKYDRSIQTIVGCIEEIDVMAYFPKADRRTKRLLKSLNNRLAGAAFDLMATGKALGIEN